MMTRGWMAAAALAVTIAAWPADAQAAPSLVDVGRFDTPMYVTSPAGDGSSILVVEGPGRLQLVDAAGTTQFADLSSRVAFDGEQGLLSAAFAPDYAQSGLLYVYYTNNDDDIVVAELRRDPLNPRRADPAHHREVLKVAHRDFKNHNGGQVAFGPDGYLYAATGDGGGGDDPGNNGQDKEELLGKLLRVDPRPGLGCGGGCTIPPDNPFVRTPDARPEIWAYGLRNPWRFSFDRLTGDLVLADVGQDAWEEINFLRASEGLGRGANFGWDCMEGHEPNTSPAECPEPADHTRPTIVKPNPPWFSITGGVVVRDPNVPSLAGRLLFTDVFRSEMLAAQLGVDEGVPAGLSMSMVSSISEDGCGRVYVTSLNGPVRRVTELGGGACAGAPAGGGPGAPTAPTAPTTPAADTSGPRVGLFYGRKQRTLRNRRIRVTVRCDESCRVRVTGRAGPRRRALPAKRRTLPASARRRITVKLSRKLTRRLRRDQRRTGKRIHARMRIRATDAAGNARTRKVRIRLKR